MVVDFPAPAEWADRGEHRGWSARSVLTGATPRWSAGIAGRSSCCWSGTRRPRPRRSPPRTGRVRTERPTPTIASPGRALSASSAICARARSFKASASLATHSAATPGPTVSFLEGVTICARPVPRIPLIFFISYQVTSNPDPQQFSSTEIPSADVLLRLSEFGQGMLRTRGGLILYVALSEKRSPTLNSVGSQ